MQTIANAHDIRPGDIIRYPVGIDRTPATVTVHDVHTYDTGGLSIRYRYTSNPRGIDWSGYIAADDADVAILSRGVARVDVNARSLLA